MDVVSQILDVVRVQGAIYYSKLVTPPWGMEVEYEPNVWRFHLVLSGSTCISHVEGNRVRTLNAGDLVIVPRGAAHFLSDHASTPLLTTHNIPGESPDIVPEMAGRPPTSGETHLVCGYFRFSSGTPIAILRDLPGLLILCSQDQHRPAHLDRLIDIFRQETEQPQKRPSIVLNRLTEILFYFSVRQWLETAMMPEIATSALGDDNVQRALASIHQSPGTAWTISTLAAVAGQSRTVFAKRFKTVTDMTPIQYLASYRTSLACRYLSETRMSMDQIAQTVGYEDTNAFNRAFKRIQGSTPGRYRSATGFQNRASAEV